MAEMNHPSESRQAVDVFLDAIADAIVDRLERRQGARRRLLDMERTVDYLGMSEDTIIRLVSDGKLTPVRVDRRLRFDIRELDNLIEASKKGH